MQKISELTPEQKAAWEAHRDKWLRIAASTEPVDRRRAEAAIRELYERRRIKAPRFYWFDSPAAAIVLSSSLRRIEWGVGEWLWNGPRSFPGVGVGKRLYNGPAGSFKPSLWDSWGHQLDVSLAGGLEDPLKNSLLSSLLNSQRFALDDGSYDTATNSLAQSFGDSPIYSPSGKWSWPSGSLALFAAGLWWDSREIDFDKIDSGWIARIALHLFAEECLGIAYAEDKDLHLWASIAESCSFWISYEKAVLVSERPLVHRVEPAGNDGRYQFHCADGPALMFRDGWGIWAWHGLKVPRRVIEAPEGLTLWEIMGEEDVEIRRAMIEKVGAAQFLRKARAMLVHSDTDGAGQPRELLRVDLPNDEPLVMVHVTDPSTGREYYLRVPPAMTRCDQAVAWTFGVDLDEYHPLIER